MNRVFLMGNLTRDPEMRKTPSGTAVSDLGLAVSEKYRNKAGEEVESTCFADIVVWGKQAEACSQYLAKGSQVLVEGRLQLDQWKNDKGETRSKLRVKADRVRFVGKNGSKGVRSADKEEPRPALGSDSEPLADDSGDAGEMPF